MWLAFVDEDFKTVTNVKWGHRGWGPKTTGHVLLKEESDTKDHTHTVKAIWGHSQKAAICNQEEKPQEKPKV